MFSRQEVAEIEAYDREMEFKENQKKYCGDLLKQIEELNKTLSFYIGEGKSKHEVEEEYVKLSHIIPSKRSEKQKKDLSNLAKTLSDAVDSADEAFKAYLDNFWKFYKKQ